MISCAFFVDDPLGKGVSAGYKAPPRQDKQTPGGSAHVPNKPLAGKVFYLDLPSNQITDTLESNIRELGGVSQNLIFSCLLLLEWHAHCTECHLYCAVLLFPLYYYIALFTLGLCELFVQFLHSILFNSNTFLCFVNRLPWHPSK